MLRQRTRAAEYLLQSFRAERRRPAIGERPTFSGLRVVWKGNTCFCAARTTPSNRHKIFIDWKKSERVSCHVGLIPLLLPNKSWRKVCFYTARKIGGRKSSRSPPPHSYLPLDWPPRCPPPTPTSQLTGSAPPHPLSTSSSLSEKIAASIISSQLTCQSAERKEYATCRPRGLSMPMVPRGRILPKHNNSKSSPRRMAGNSSAVRI